MDAKEELKELFRYGIYKLDNNLCTMEEVSSLTKVLHESLELDGSIKDIAGFYGASEVNVRSVIHNKLFAKPKRKVLYPFQKFIKVVPQRWREKKMK